MFYLCTHLVLCFLTYLLRDLNRVSHSSSGKSGKSGSKGSKSKSGKSSKGSSSSSSWSHDGWWGKFTYCSPNNIFLQFTRLTSLLIFCLLFALSVDITLTSQVPQAVLAASQARVARPRRHLMMTMIGVRAAQMMIGVAHQVLMDGQEAAVVPMITTMNQKSSTPRAEV